MSADDPIRPLFFTIEQAQSMGLKHVPAYYDFKTDEVKPVTPEVFEQYHAKTVQVAMTLQLILRTLHELANAPNNLKLGRALSIVQGLGKGQVEPEVSDEQD